MVCPVSKGISCSSIRMVGRDVDIILVRVGRCIVAMDDAPGIVECLVEIKLRSEVLLQILLERMRKKLQAIGDMVGCGVSQAAMGIVLNQAAQLLYFLDILNCALSIRNFIQMIFQQVCAYTAGSAKSTAFMREKLRKIAVNGQ